MKSLCDPMDCSPPGSSIHGIFQARILERVAISLKTESRRKQRSTWLIQSWSVTTETYYLIMGLEIGIQNLSSLTQSGLLVPFTEISQSSLKANSVTLWNNHQPWEQRCWKYTNSRCDCQHWKLLTDTSDTHQMRALNQFHRFSRCLIWDIKGVWSALLKITYPESISASQPHWAIISGNAYSWKHLAIWGHSRNRFSLLKYSFRDTHVTCRSLPWVLRLPPCACRDFVVLVAQSCPTLCNPMQSPPGSSVHGILQAWILKWAAIPFSRGSSQPRGRTQVSHTACRFFFFYHLSHKESLETLGDLKPYQYICSKEKSPVTLLTT